MDTDVATPMHDESFSEPKPTQGPPRRAGNGLRPQVPGEDEIVAGLTPPQQEAVRCTEGPLLVLAGPGSGKTRVITRRIAYLIACGIPAYQILAVTFTNKAAAEMRERVVKLLGEGAVSRGLTVTTFHALCARLIRKYADIAKLPGITGTFAIFDTDDQSSLVKKAIEQAGVSTSNWPARSVLSKISAAKNDLLGPEEYAAQAFDFNGRTIAKIYSLYQKGLRASNAVDFDDLLLLTAQMLKNNQRVREMCRERWQYLLVDEYQDTNTAQFQIAALLAGAGTGEAQNICVVGDPDQCLPPGTMVATPKGRRRIEAIKDGDEVVSGIGWGATSRKRVDKVVRRRHTGPLVRVRTTDGADLRGTPNHIVFARLRADSALSHTYLMWKRGMGYRIGVTRGVRASKDGELVSGLQVRTNQEVADAIWVLHSGTSPSEARYYEHYYSVRYGIPTMVFFVRGRNMGISQEQIDRLYRSVDTEAGANRLMQDLRLDRRYPHHRPGGVTRATAIGGPLSRKHVLFTVFGGPRRIADDAWHEHRVQLVTSDKKMRVSAADKFKVRDGVRGTWRIETSRKDYLHGLELAEEIATLSQEMEIISRARLTPDKAFVFMPLSHLRPGMCVPRLRGDEVVESCVESVEHEMHTGWVYDLSVPDTRNYVAGGMVVHNSIYGWRGADIENILQFEKHFPRARTIALGENFRSTKHIIGAADTLIRNNKKRKHKDLFTSNAQGVKPEVVICRDEHHEARLVVDWIKARREESMSGEDGVEGSEPLNWKDFAVFYRTNALSRVVEDVLRNEAIPYIIARGTAFYQREEIKHALAYLRVVANPADEVSLGRIVNTPSRGIGDTTIERVEQLAAQQGVRMLDALRTAPEALNLATRTAGSIRKFVGMVDAWAGIHEEGMLHAPAAEGSLAELVERVIRESGLEEMYKKMGEEEAERLENLSELISSAREFEDTYDPSADPGADPLTVPLNPDELPQREPSLLELLRGYLERVTLVADADSIDPAQGAVTLMTLHAAKGLEFAGVAMVGLEEGLLPHSRVMEHPGELEEERRLCFVGITRAMRRLMITSARYRTIRGVTERTIESRFIHELPKEHVTISDQAGFSEPGWDRPSGRLGGGGGAGEGPRFVPDAPPPGKTRVSGPKDSRGLPLVVGSQVRHPQFGIGRIVGLTTGQDARANIEFRQAGRKTLVLQYARLERVE